jgi:hypothetical protein
LRYAGIGKPTRPPGVLERTVQPHGWNTPLMEQACSALAEELDEPLHGTAPVSPAWLLLEQPGAWGAEALEQSGLDPKVAGELKRLGDSHGFKILLIRRSPGRYQSESRTCLLARAARSETWMRRISFADPTELLDLDFSLFQQPTAPAIGEDTGSAYLVCTNSRRDPCCAERGRALMRSLPRPGREIWESAHQGGHRFAANLACFPHALFYGRADNQAAELIVESHIRGEVVVDHLRGRSADLPIVQAADYFVRISTGEERIDGLAPETPRDLGSGRWEVRMRRNGSVVAACMESFTSPPRKLSCLKEKLSSPEHFRLISLTEEAPALDTRTVGGFPQRPPKSAAGTSP